MKARFYAAQDGIGMLKITIELGKPGLRIELSDKNLNWNEIVIDKKYADRLIKFLQDNPME